MESSKTSVRKSEPDDIRVIPVDSVRTILTGQVVASLAGACKELIDNALDADANIIGNFRGHVHLINQCFRRSELLNMGSNLWK